MKLGVPIVGANVSVWANDLRNWLARSWGRLPYREATGSATEDGMMLWDRAGYPVVTKDGAFRQVVLADGYAVALNSTSIAAAAADTAYAIAWDALPMSSGVALSGSPATRLTFTESGLYSLGFTAQIYSTKASQVDFWFWPKLNGTNVAGSTIRAALHDNTATTVVSRTAIMQVSAGDYLEAMWATDDTKGSLHAFAATAFAPATPSVTLTVSRFRQ